MPATTLPTSLDPVVVDGLSVCFGSRHVLTDVDLVAQPGRRIGLVGENGSGKSTLLRAVAGRLPGRATVTGRVRAPGDLVLLGQEPPFRDDHTVAQVLGSALAPLRGLAARVEELAARLEREGEDAAVRAAYARTLEAAVLADAWDADRRAATAAADLGLDGLDDARPVHTLSGGQRTRLALATIMAVQPTAVLLDEPSNHLDDGALAVLERFLRSLPGVVLVASHDRVLLDEVCTDLVDLEPGELGTDGRGGRRFGGGWSDYEAHRRSARRRWEETYATQQEELRRLRRAAVVDERAIAPGRGPTDNDKFIHAFKGAKVQRTVARRRKDASRRLAEAERSQVRKPRPPLRFTGTLTGPATGPARASRPTGPGAAGGGARVVQVRDLEVAGSSGPRTRLERLDVLAGEHLLVTGPNGSGKSTLLGVLSGRVQPGNGTVRVAARRVAELEQDVTFADPSRTPQQVYADHLAGCGIHEPPALPDLGLLRPEDLRRPVGTLSVGQRRRLGLALVVATGPDLLLLDEPTNHLSLALAGEIEEALGTTPGTVVLASHDRWLRRRWSGAVLALDPLVG